MPRRTALKAVRHIVVENEGQRYSDSISELPDAALMCRLKRHSWEHVTDTVLSVNQRTKEPREIKSSFKCANCTTQMDETIQVPSFDLLSRKYYYAAGYLLSKKATNGERVYVNDFRQERFVRAGIVSR